MIRLLSMTLAVLSILAIGVGRPWSGEAQAAACTPQVRINSSVLEKVRGEVTASTVSLSAAAPVAGGDKIVSVSFTSVTNAVVEIGGVPHPVPGTYALPSPAGSWSFVMRKVARGDSMMVGFVVRDLCGDFTTFFGLGRNADGSTATSTPSTAPTSTVSATPTNTSVPSTATSTPTKTATSTPTTVPPTATTIPPTSTAVPPTATPVSSEGAVALGVAANDVVWTSASVDSFDAMVGRHSQIVQWYQPWGQEKAVGDYQPALDTEALQRISARGSTPMITWEAWGKINGVDPSHVRNITNGSFDAYIDSWATGLRGHGRPVYLRLFHEMNGDWYPWSYNVNGNSAADLIAAWRYVHGRFQQAGATNVIWVWSPNIEDGRVSYNALYPGDAYVDWFGVDGYNRGTHWSYSSWQTPAQLFQRSFDSIQALNGSKPIVIAETSSVEEGGSKGAWVSSLYSQLPLQFPRLRAIVWFHYDMSYNSNESNWKLDTSSGPVTAYTSSTNSPTYAQANSSITQ
jgi:hypothetical protein